MTHASLPQTHEAMLAVRRVEESATGNFLTFCTLLFEKQEQFFDINVGSLTKADIYAQLCDIAKEAGVDAEKVKELLQLDATKLDQGMKNPGTYVNADLKASGKKEEFFLFFLF